MFAIQSREKLCSVGKDAYALVEMCTNEISNSQILDEFCSHTTVVFNGNRILASVYGSFALVRGHKILAYIHVVPKDVCREHKLYYLNGNLFCTGEKHPANTCSENLLRNSGLTSGSNEIERNRKKLYCVEKATYDESNQRKSSTNGWSTGDDTGFIGGNCNEIEVLDNDRDQTTNQQQGRRLAPSKRYQSTWLDISQWLNVVSQNGRWQESARMSIRRLEYPECISNSNEVITSSVVLYPLAVAGYSYVLHVMKNERTLISSELVVNTMRQLRIVKLSLRKDRYPDTFLADEALPGTYAVSPLLLDSKVYVVICKYERHHAGHRGRFACGYSYFLCGLSASTAYRVLLRAEMINRWCEATQFKAGVNGAVQLSTPHRCGSKSHPVLEQHRMSNGQTSADRLRITISRSYSGDCQGISLPGSRHPLPEPKTEMPPLPAIQVIPSSGTPASIKVCSYAPLVDWLLSKAKKTEHLDKKPSVNDKTVPEIQDPESLVIDNSTKSQACPAGFLCKACGKVQQISNRYTYQRHLKLDALHKAYVKLHDVQFADHIELIEANCGKCKVSRGIAVETSELRHVTKPTRKVTESNVKYVAQRRRLILRYNKDLKISQQAWFSICPEEIARHIGSRLKKLQLKLGRRIRILEPFCGAGGNAINCARMPHVERVYAFDIDANETFSARQLAQLYDVSQKLTIVAKDTLSLRPEDLPNTVDAVVFSPPWGGPKYQDTAIYDLASICKPASYNEILRHFLTFSRSMAVVMPRNSCLDQLVLSARKIGFSAVELEQNVLSGKIKTVTVYYNDLAN
ncbi:uncharacterized protein LOC111243688 isoform X2 [Varroa destructor]|nr:uncharacterized protein LOC111243688 isoform X2 [Varroa destructor]